ncbi:alpha/beta fold hydrolase [Actinoplanes sp. NPDC049548]|uniref:alpha/beta fold hydrolase n=1 Tax=Actinoplanes sp. NPDC049548 TaxID=3155152 RepID=UPI00342BAA1B
MAIGSRSALRCTALVAGLVLLAAGGLLAAYAGHGLRSSSESVDGVPVELVRPPGAASGRPAVVVAHGFAGSGRLMRPFADTLARRGYVVALPDLTGHGANTRPLTGQDDVDHDLAAVIRYVRARPDVDPDRVTLVGHSMGAAAVVRAGSRDPRIAATVAISLGDSTAATPPGPRRLLLVVGALEPAGIRSATEAAATTGSRLVRVPLAEHVGVLYADRTHHETARWLDEAVGERPERTVIAAKQRVSAGALVLAGALLLMTSGLRRRTARPVLPPRETMGWIAGATVLAPLAGTAGGLLVSAGPQPSVCGYLIGYLGFAGLTLAAAAVVLHRPLRPRPPSWRSVAGATGLAVAGVATVLLPIQLGVTSAVPYGPHGWLVLFLALATALLLASAHALAGPPWSILVLALVCLPLPAAAAVGLAPGFLALVAPLIAGLFAVHLLMAAPAWLSGTPWWRTVPAGAVMIAWPVATALPLALSW